MHVLKSENKIFKYAILNACTQQQSKISKISENMLIMYYS